MLKSETITLKKIRTVAILMAVSLLGTPPLAAAEKAGAHPAIISGDVRPFDDGWRFLRDDATGAEKPGFDYHAWRLLDLPHDWSIEDLPASTAPATPTLDVVPGIWRFQPGDDAAWKEPAFDDHAWQQVKLPDTWQHHSNYTQEQVYGWFRRHLEVPVALKGRAAVIALGRVDDVDETYLNGQRIGDTGSFPPAFKSAWDVQRYYPVPAGLLKGDGTDVLAVRVYNDSNEGGITAAGVPDVVIGPFAPKLSDGGGATGHVVGGIGWYRKSFSLPASDQNQRVSIEFDGLYMDSDVWINGIHLGNHPNGYTSFSYDLTPHLASAGTANILAVRVRNLGRNSRWYSGSGIYRHVRLVVTDPARIGHWGVAVTTPQVSTESATVRVETRVDNGRLTPIAGEVRILLRAPDGSEAAMAQEPVHISAGTSGTAGKMITLRSPRLWSNTSPQLYRAEIALVVGGTVVNQTTVPFGIRSIAFDAEHGFRLNGTTLKLKGACLHHENGPLGAVAIDRAEERRVELMKANGFNAIRCAHNPPSPYFLDVCDRLGMLVIDEAFDAWNHGKNPDDYSRYFKDWWERDIDSLVLRDRNHPCVIMWSVGNEIPEEEAAEGAKTCAMLAERVRLLDPSRPVTDAYNGPTEKGEAFFAALDVCGYNYQLNSYELDHQRLPNRIIYASESFPTQAYDQWKGVTDHSWVIGDFVWSGFDYMGESGGGSCVLDGEYEGWPWYIVNCGDLDLCGFKRVPSYCRDVVWGRSKLEMAVHRPLPPGRSEKTNGWGWPDELRSWTWPGQEGQPMQVRVFTSGDQVRLLLNGKEVGRAGVPPAAKQIATFTVPYASGTLRAVALSGSDEIACREFVTTGPPKAIRLTADRAAIRASRNDLSFVTVEIVDDAGRLVPDAEVKVGFTVSGPGELAATGGGDPKNPASFRQPERLTFHGRCLAVIRPTNGNGTITLRADANGLTGASIGVTSQTN